MRRLFLFITLRYRSFRSEVANLPPSSCTIGRSSGGSTGTASMIIHSGLLPLFIKASTTSRRLMALLRFWPEELSISLRSSSSSFSRSSACKSSFMASAPIPARKDFGPYSAWASRYSLSESTCLYMRGVVPGSSTTKAAKYSTFSRERGDISSSIFMRQGMPLKYHIWDTGAASSMWPMRSRRTFALVTSTPHLSQTTPL